MKWYMKPLLWLQKRKFGQVLLASETWARRPRLFFAMTHFYKAVDSGKSPLSPSFRSLVMEYISRLNQCAFCEDLNAQLFLERGGSREVLDALENRKTSPLLSPCEKVVLEYAEKMTLQNPRKAQALHASLKTFFSDEEIIEITALIAYQNLSSRFNAALGIPSQGLCKL